MTGCMKRAVIGVLLLVSMNSVYAMKTYGPTQYGDTIWKVAKQSRVSGVSTEAMIQAIETLNPSAFGGTNHNTLLLGKTLQIPTSKEELNQVLHKPLLKAASPVPSAAPVSVAAPAPAPVAAAVSPALVKPKVTTPIANASVEVQKTTSGWAWLWFVLFLIILGLYVRARVLIKQLRRTHHIVSLRLGAGRKGPLGPKEVARYNTLGMKSKDLNKTTASTSAEAKVLSEVNQDLVGRRFEEAEKRLLNAIRQNKMNMDLRMKLLDVYVAMDNQSSFSKQAEYIIKNMITENDEAWAKIRALYLKTWVYDE